MLESFEITNRLRHLNRFVQACLILLLLFGLNFLSLSHFSRIDLTESNRYALSAESIAYLKQLEQPVTLIVTIPDSSASPQETALLRYLKLLLREYAIAGQRDGRAFVRIEYVDVFRDRDRAQALSKDFGVNETHCLIVQREDRYRLLRADELMRFKDQQPVAYIGEAALTSAILEVDQEQAPVIYFLSGHGETRLDDAHPRDGLSAFGKELRSRNIETRTLDLSTAEAVPDDAGLLVMANPRGPLSTKEVEKIRLYLGEQSGRLLLWLAPESQHGLESLLPQWGIKLPAQRVHEGDPDFIESGQSLLIRNFVDHPSTRHLIDNEVALLVGQARPVLPVRPTPLDERLKVTPLFATSAQSWAFDIAFLDRKRPFNAELDTKGPVPIAVASQREAAGQLGIDIPGGKLLVIGSHDIFSNRHVQSLGNSSLAFSILNWMLERNRLIAIPPKEVVSYNLHSSEAELRKTGLLFLTVPLGLAALGFLIFWIRKT
jgi:hypothetical protein